MYVSSKKPKQDLKSITTAGSYPLSARGHDISPRADRLKGWDMNEG